MLIVLAVAGGSCKKTYLSELANSPNVPAVTTPALQLSGALTVTATRTTGTSEVQYLCWAGYMAENTGTQPISSLLLYNITTGTYDNFSPLYLNISNYNAILQSSTEPYYVAIAKIMIVYDFQQLVDQYGNVPYFQVMKGINNLTPAYDDASAIYDDLLKQLDAAIVLINGAPITAATPGKFDVVYGATNAAGMAKWKAAANTLKLRIAIRQSSKATVFAAKKAALTTSIAATAAEGYITTANEFSVNPGYANVDPQQSPLDLAYGYKASGAVAGSGATYQANSFAVNLLVGAGTNPTAPDDPRLNLIYAPSTSAAALGKIESTALGATTSPKEGTTQVNASKLASFVLTPTKSSPLIQASEAYFLQAEAIKAGLITGTPANEQTMFNNGIAASFTEFGLTAAQLATYMTKPIAIYPVGGTDAQREQAIITEKWISFGPYLPLEAYTELRRTNYPAVPLSILSGVTATSYVARLPYPTAEYNTNANNVGAQGTIDIFASKPFWMN